MSVQEHFDQKAEKYYEYVYLGSKLYRAGKRYCARKALKNSRFAGSKGHLPVTGTLPKSVE